MPTATSLESRALAGGLRVRRRPSQPIWLSVAALAVGGLALGTVLAGAPSEVVLGTLAVLLTAGAALYRPALGLALLAFTYPFDLKTYAGPVKLTTSAALMAVLVLTFVIRQFLPNPPEIRRTPLDVPVLLFGGATVLSLAGLTGNTGDELVALLKAFGGFLIFFIATQSLRSFGDALLLVAAVIATGLIQAVGTAVPFLTGTHLISEETRSTGTLVDANLFSGYLVLVIPLVIALGVSFRQRWTLIPTTAATLAFVVALAATLSRSGWLALIAGALVLWFLLPARRWRIAAMAGGIAIFAIGLGLAGPIATRLGPHDTGPWQMLADRWDVWIVAVRMTFDHPIFGVGIANFENFYPAYSGNSWDLNHAHNLFLNVAAERGLPALFALGILVGFLCYALARARSSASTWPKRALIAGLAASFAAYFIHSLFDVSYYDYQVLLLFWLLMGVGAMAGRLSSESEPERAPLVERKPPHARPRVVVP